jgi:hypothetical protein
LLELHLHNLLAPKHQAILRVKSRKAQVTDTTRIHSKDTPMAQPNHLIPMGMEWAWICAVAGSKLALNNLPYSSLFLIDAYPFEQSVLK